MTAVGSSFALTEQSTSWEPQLLPEELAALQASGAVTVTGAPGGGWTLRTSQWVGVVRHGTTEVRIRPKVPVERLLFLLGFAADPSGWRDEAVAFHGADDHVAAIAYAFINHAERSLMQGVLQGYVHREEALHFIRGRLRTSDQLARRSGLALPVELSFDDYTPDIPENQLLVAAAEALLRSGLPAGLRPRFRHLLRLLDGVSPWPTHRRVPTIRWTRLNRRYEPAVRLAILILQGVSYRAERGETQGSGFLFDMNRVFEDFLGVALTRSLQRFGGRVQLQHRSHLDRALTVEVRPDVTWWRGGQCLSVIDAKYRTLSAGSSSGDLYQLLAYCTTYDVRRGHLVYAHTDAAAQHTYEVRHTGVELFAHAVGLDRPPELILDRMDQIGEVIAQSRELSGSVVVRSS